MFFLKLRASSLLLFFCLNPPIQITLCATDTIQIDPQQQQQQLLLQLLMNYENLALEVKNISKLNNISVHPLIISKDSVVTRNLLTYLQNTGLIKNTIRVGQIEVLLKSVTQYTIPDTTLDLREWDELLSPDRA